MRKVSITKRVLDIENSGENLEQSIKHQKNSVPLAALALECKVIREFMFWPSHACSQVPLPPSHSHLGPKTAQA